jgi:hypothetical protein
VAAHSATADARTEGRGDAGAPLTTLAAKMKMDGLPNGSLDALAGAQAPPAAADDDDAREERRGSTMAAGADLTTLAADVSTESHPGRALAAAALAAAAAADAGTEGRRFAETAHYHSLAAQMRAERLPESSFVAAAALALALAAAVAPAAAAGAAGAAGGDDVLVANVYAGKRQTRRTVVTTA